MGIAFIWYTPSTTPIPYEACPQGGYNLLPCNLEIINGANGYYILQFLCSQKVSISVGLSFSQWHVE